LDRLTKHRRKLVTLVLLAAAYFVYRADFWRAERFKERVRVELEQALGRKVIVQGPASYSWRTAPGITVEDVTIFEDPRHGREPLMYAGAIQTRLRILPLLTGRLALDLIRLDSPSVNLSRHAGGVNVTPLLERLLARRRPDGDALPDVRIVNGRLNFVSERRKSVLYLANADLELVPVDERTFRVQFEGAPARTDRKAAGFGRFRTTGLLRLGHGNEESTADLTLELDNTTLAEVASLIDPKAANLGGKITSRAQLKGTFREAAIDGTMSFSAGKRDLNPLKTSVPLNYTGRISAQAQTLELDAARAANPELGAHARFRAREILTQPRWAGLVTFHDVPSGPLLAIARDLALMQADPALLTGTLAGAIGIVNGLPQGGALINGPVTQDRHEWNAGLVVDGPAIALALDLRDAPVKALKPFLEKTLPGAVPVWFANLQDGTLAGQIRVNRRGDEAAAWAGSLRLANASLAVAGISEPLAGSALAEFEGDRLAITDLKGNFPQAGLAVRGTYKYDPAVPRPHRFVIDAGAVTGAKLEKLLAPTLRHEGGLLRAATLPDWLSQIQAEGTLRIRELDLGGVRLPPAQAVVRWEGPQVTLQRLQAGGLQGVLRIGLTGPQPVYVFDGTLVNAPWKEGRLEGKFHAETSGTGSSLWTAARVGGTWGVRGIRVTPELEVRQGGGTLSGGPPPLRLTNLQLVVGSESYTGEGTVDGGGKWNAVLSTSTRQLKLTGQIWPLTLESLP